MTARPSHDVITDSLRQCACAALFQAARDLDTLVEEPVISETSPAADKLLALQSHARYRQAVDVRLSALLWLTGAWRGKISFEDAIDSVRAANIDMPLTRPAFMAWILTLEQRNQIGHVFSSVNMTSHATSPIDSLESEEQNA